MKMKSVFVFLLVCVLVYVILGAATVEAAEQCCTVPGNGQGTANLPSPGCQLVSEGTGPVLSTPDGAGSLHTRFVVDSFFDVEYRIDPQTQGQVAQFGAAMRLEITGEGTLEGMQRNISFNVEATTRDAPRDAGDPVQSFDTEMVALQGQLFGDPDFDVLHVVAGSEFGLPSPGHTTLTRQPGGDFVVDSFFDITYQIDFAGSPGSALGGLVGSTLGTIRVTTCPPPQVKKIIKFRQLPLNGQPSADGVKYPYYGHDELSTAYSWYDFAADGTVQFLGYRGCFMADDFADKSDQPVVCVSWWGSYIDNLIPQPVGRFLIVFEEDVPADPVSNFSHPGKVLSSEIVKFNLTTDPNLLAPGEYSETVVGSGGEPCNERLYRYVAVLENPFPQKPDTVYWIKIVALVDLPPSVAGELEGCLDNSAAGPIPLCDFLNLPLEQQHAICPNLEPITRWGWHNRDYRRVNPEASTSVLPGEQNQQDMFGFVFPTAVWHFQDDSVSGNVFVDPSKPLDADLCPNCPFVRQDGFKPENYVYDRICQTAGTPIMGVDGPQGIEVFSKDMAFVLLTTEEQTNKDCNNNGVPDHIDISNGTSDDCNGNGIPDECENDCNCNGVPDDQDIANGTSLDCNHNGIPDECEQDCNGNGVPDDCDIASGTSKDCNSNGIPDECEIDCNENGIPDDCDIADGTSKDVNNNGIPDECEPPCENPRVFTCMAGNIDNFDTSDGSEPTSPSAYLAANPGYCYNGGLTQFDVLPTNTCFIHTISCCWPANWQVIDAKLEICLKGGNYITHTDSMHFRQNGVNLWGISLNNLIAWQTGGTDTVWSKGQSECFTLDLSDLPLAGTDILADLAAGFLDVVVADDTGVDYMILTVTVCPCKYQGDVIRTAGIPDNFATPTEPAIPGTLLQTFCSPSKDFDSWTTDRCFGHTFTGLSPNLLSAELEIHLKAFANAATCNDGISLQATAFGPPDFAWSRALGTGGPYSWCTGAPGLLPTPWVFGSDHTFTLNLAALPNADSTTTCLLPLLIADGRLDVRVSDDSVVDYMILKTRICCKKVVKKGGISDLNDDLVTNFLDLSLMVSDWGQDVRAEDASDTSDPPAPAGE